VSNPIYKEACVFYYNGKNLPDYHRFDIPVEWSYEHHENGAGLAYKSVTKLRCVCGAEIDRVEATDLSSEPLTPAKASPTSRKDK